MAEKTPYFGLEYFVVGDYYSAIIDKRRFDIIDQGMAFISDLIGPGIINGWDLSVDNNLTLTISSGWGMIGRNIVKTYGSYSRSLVDNNQYYVWMRGRPGIMAQLSGFSKPSSVNYVDTGIPSSPTNLQKITSDTDSVLFTWNAVSDIDIDLYVIYRSTNNINFEEIDRSTKNEYLDVALQENTIYYYKVKSLDLSGNLSNFSSTLTVVTNADVSKPSDPANVKIVVSNQILYLTWDSSPFGIVAKYVAYVTPISVDEVAQGLTLAYETTYDKVDLSINNLANNQLYKVIFRAVSVNGVESDGIIKKATPQNVDGPPDILSITVEDIQNSATENKNVLYISWATYDNPYESFDGYGEILLEEYNQDGTIIISEWIRVPFGIVNKSIGVFLYKKNNTNFYKSVQSRNTYYITVRNVSIDGKTSVGKRIKHVTANFEQPLAPTSLGVIQNADLSLTLRFDNSISLFSSNFLRIEKITDSAQFLVLDYINIGKATFYALGKEFVEPSVTYVFSIYCVDEFENQSETVSVSYETPAVIAITPPEPPRCLIFPGDKQNTITWDVENRDTISQFKVYRGLDTYDLTSSSFELIATVEGGTTTFTDYDVENNTSYVYFVSATNVLGVTSQNIFNNPRAAQAIVIGTPKSVSILPLVKNINVNILANSVEITWQPTGGVFDGYEIYRSIDNNYSYTLLTTVNSSVSYHVDQNVLRKTGSVYYIVRKFRNESEPFITESLSQVTNATILGKISIKNGVTTIDKSLSRNIANLEDPVRIETRKAIAAHKHEYISDIDDRRINLSDVIAVTDWVTLDNQSFTTTEDISETTTQQVFLNDKPASEYNIAYVLDKALGKLTFDVKLAATGYESDVAEYPFDELPLISVRLGGIDEVQGLLPNNRLRSLFANQVTSGKFINNQINAVNHDGRIKEKLVPQTIIALNMDDGYRYALTQEGQDIGGAVVFYDIISINEENIDLLASTSDGIYTSSNFGISWTRRFTLTSPVVKFFYSKKYDSFFAATNTGFYFARGNTADDLRDWREVAGAENTKIIRDIVEDNQQDIYCTSDLGVYKLRKSINDNVFFLEQLPIFGPISTEGYAILFDQMSSRLVVSNSLGLFESYDAGENWFFSEEFTEQRPVYQFAQTSLYTYALTDFMIWRKSYSEYFYRRVGVLEDVGMSRKLLIWNDRIIVSTDLGVYVSSVDANIYEDDFITFTPSYIDIRIKAHILPATSLNIINDKLFIGTENRIYLSENVGRAALHYENAAGLMPTIYINGNAQKIGYRFTTDNSTLGKYICFDYKLDTDDEVRVANQYTVFVSEFGGWVQDNYISAVTLYLNGQVQNEISLAERPAAALQAIALPVYNDRNANAYTAGLAESLFISARDALLLTNVDQDNVFVSFANFNKDYVVRTLGYLDKFVSQLYEEARVVQTTDANNNTIQAAFSVPQFRVLLLNQPINYNKQYLGSFGLYNSWIRNNSNSTSPGNFGSELDETGSLNKIYLGGDASLGIEGGGTNVAGGLLLPDTTTTKILADENSTVDGNNNIGG